MSPLKAPFPYFGGKSRVASEIWDRFGNVPNYIEPFAGSLAVLLARPHSPGVETVNDLNGLLCNFWRATQHQPDEVAKHVIWPVIEADKHARHTWLRTMKGSLTEALISDPYHFDPQAAGWWVWGAGQWIGGGWGESAARQIPALGCSMGIIASMTKANGPDVVLQRMRTLRDRMFRVRVTCGDWSRVLTPAVTTGIGLTGVLLDPPYDTDHCEDVYRTGSVSTEVRQWAIDHGDDPMFRIALCGYEGEHEMPHTWTEFAWKANGGYGNQGNGRGKANASRERIWFSPHCLKSSLFDDLP